MSGKAEAVQQAVALRHEAAARARALRWGAANALLFALLAYDLSVKCPGYTSALHCVEALLAAVLLANALQHALRLGLGRSAVSASSVVSAPPAPPPPGPAEDACADVSLSPRRWRASPPPSPPAPPSPPSPPSPRLDPFAPDEFIADRRGLADYLRAYSQRADEAAPGLALSAAPLPAPAVAAPRPPAYQLAVLDAEGPEEGAGAAGAGEARATLWRRLRLEPRRLDRYTYNLRLWLHLTILERLVRQLDAADAGGAAGADAEAALLPYLQPFADRAYVRRRVRELAAGGCLGAYRWDGGGAGRAERPGRPTDAELLLHLLLVYLDAQLGGAFSARHVSRAPSPSPRGPRALALRVLAPRPPHLALVLGDELLEVARGRDNLFHAVLLLLAAAARADPPTLHLGPTGLNMLWIVER